MHIIRGRFGVEPPCLLRRQFNQLGFTVDLQLANPPPDALTGLVLNERVRSTSLP